MNRYKRTGTLITFLVLSIAIACFVFSAHISKMLSRTPAHTIDTDITQNDQPQEIIKEVIVNQGDTLSSILTTQNLPAVDTEQIIALVSSNPQVTKLRVGQVIKFYYETDILTTKANDSSNSQLILNRILLKKDQLRSTALVRHDEGFVLHNLAHPLKKIISRYETTIDSNFITALKKIQMSAHNIVNLVAAYSYQIDMQRQIKRGDKITILVEKFVTSNNEFSHYGKIIYSSLTSQGTTYKIYSFSPTGSKQDSLFFSDNGQSIKSSLLKTPVDIIKVSSHYGRRHHPILGFTKMHKGVDFAASVGTPIYAAGDGIVTFAGWKSGYGRFLRISHSKNISTAYAHASRFAANITNGCQVKQGQIIAYVGDSGYATGPHLHYEVLVNGNQVNPLTFDSKPIIRLSGKNLAKFNEFKKRISHLNNQLLHKQDISFNLNQAI